MLTQKKKRHENFTCACLNHPQDHIHYAAFARAGPTDEACDAAAGDGGGGGGGGGGCGGGNKPHWHRIRTNLARASNETS